METRGRLGRRRLLGRTGAVAGAVSGAGLGFVPGFASVAGAQASGKTIMVGMSQEPPTLGYSLGNAYVISIVKAAIGNEPTLTRRNDLNDWVPWLAETVPTLENGGARYVGDGADKRLQVTFTMRKDVKWSDGKAVTSADVKFAWELIMNPDYSVPDRSTQQKLATVETPDDYTVVANFMSESEAKEAAANGRGGLPAKAYADFASQSGPVLDPGYYKAYLPAFPKHVLQPLLEKVGAADLPKQ
ncbi:MAG: ABC transporter substrate-binding protein, partial [bacterium]